ncbi:HemK family protein methyltransferase [Candidatus Gracilibacteria bacterium]|nr:HemK family protein methyltransferase [Candidatus Gracilibacteria bacterium]
MKKSEFYEYGVSCFLSKDSIERVLCKVLGCSREDLFLKQDIPASFLYDFQKYVYEFKKGVPESYILGQQEFYGREFYVEPCTLIPRRETELLVDVMRDICLFSADMQTSSYIDIGTGTTCILSSLILELHPLQFQDIYAVDINSAILKLSQRNLERHHIAGVTLLEGSLLSVFLSEKKSLQKTLYISANLPYIKYGDEKNMGNDVVKYEPDSALYGGNKTGFELYTTLLHQCFLLKNTYKLKDIHVCIEIGYDQYDYSQDVLTELGLRFEYFTDFRNIKRVIYISGF